MLTIHKVSKNMRTVVVHARRDLSNRTVCGQVITTRDEILSPKHWEPQSAVTCAKCKKGV